MAKQKATVIIPARYGSLRFPGKALAKIGGKALIQHVFERVKQCGVIDHIIVATDDPRIQEASRSFGADVEMTDANHKSGSERCAEVIKKRGLEQSPVINVQGDEPLINPMLVDRIAEELEKENTCIVTAISRISNPRDLFSPHVVKVVTDHQMRALYFSRMPLPFQQKIAWLDWLDRHVYFRHIGIYGFAPGMLTALARLPRSPLEKAESLEQLRWLENAFNIQCIETEYEGHGVDIAEDLEKIKNIIEKK